MFPLFYEGLWGGGLGVAVGLPKRSNGRTAELERILGTRG